MVRVRRGRTRIVMIVIVTKGTVVRRIVRVRRVRRG